MRTVAAARPRPPGSSGRVSSIGRIHNHEMYEMAFGTVYVGLMTNFLVIVSTLPLVVLVLTTHPATSWPALALFFPLTAPALVGAFAVFRGYSMTGSTTVVRSFWQAWRRYLGRSLAIGVMQTLVSVIAGLNLGFLWTTEDRGALLIPVQVVLMGVAAATALVALVALPELSDVRLREVLRIAVLVAIRRWYASCGALLAVILLGAAIIEKPAVGLGIAVAPLLFAGWGALRFALLRALVEKSSTP